MPRTSKLTNMYSRNPAFARGYVRSQTYIRLGTVLRRLREDAGLTQQALAEKTRVDQGDISRLEAGTWGKRGISFEVLSRVLPVFGLRIAHEIKPLSMEAVTEARQERANEITDLLRSA